MSRRVPLLLLAALAGLAAAACAPVLAAQPRLIAAWPPDEARPVVEGLVRLAREAVESGRSVYLWNLVASTPSARPQKPSFWQKLFRA